MYDTVIPTYCTQNGTMFEPFQAIIFSKQNYITHSHYLIRGYVQVIMQTETSPLHRNA